MSVWYDPIVVDETVVESLQGKQCVFVDFVFTMTVSKKGNQVRQSKSNECLPEQSDYHYFVVFRQVGRFCDCPPTNIWSVDLLQSKRRTCDYTHLRGKRLPAASSVLGGTAQRQKQRERIKHAHN